MLDQRPARVERTVLGASLRNLHLLQHRVYSFCTASGQVLTLYAKKVGNRDNH